MNNLYTFNEFLSESYISLNEAFQSQNLAQFVSLFPQKSLYAKLPKGVFWDQIPDDEVLVGASLDDDYKKLVKKDEYAVFWFNDTKKLLKYNVKQKGKYPHFYKVDQSAYLPAGYMFITRGDKFLTDTRNIIDSRIATDKHDKPMWGELGSVKRVYDELSLTAIAIKWDILVQYSSEQVLKLRESQKKGALALQKVQNILNQNERRYREYVQKAKVEKGTKELTIKTEEKMNSITSEMDKLSSITTYDLFNTRFSDFKEDKFGKLDFNTDIIKKLEKFANEYNEISYTYSNYVDYFKSGLSGDEYYKERGKTFEEKLLKLIA